MTISLPLALGRMGALLLSLLGLWAHAQTPVQQIDRWVATNPPEKLYLQTDKPYYAAGDTIWLSAFAVDGILHETGATSRVAYAQLINSTGDLIDQRIIRLTDGRGQADITLSDSLVAGDYQLVAFTNWMRNQPADYFFRQNLHVWRTRPTAQRQPVAAPTPDLQFFPEGGQLVAGIPCRVAFKATDSHGQALAVEGVVADKSGKGVAIPFKSVHNGTGLFYLTPELGQQYTAKLADGSLYQLPTVQAQGVGFWVENRPDLEQIRVTTYNPNAAPGDLTLLALLRGRVCFEAVVPNGLRSTAIIPYNKIPDDGVVTVTLFDARQQPRCERLVFVNQQRQLTIKTTFSQASYGPHEPVTVKVAVTDPTGKPVATDLALSVTDADRVALTTEHADNLRSNLLLTSDVAGYVDEPAQYLDPTNANAARDADLLMMTQGWRRFVWSQPVLSPTYAREEGLTLTGQVLRLNNKPLPSGQVDMILSAGAESRFATVAVDSAGKFAVTDVDLIGPINLLAKGMNQSGKQTRSVVLNPLLTYRPTYQIPPATDSLVVPTLFLAAEQERATVAEMFRFTSGRTLAGVEVKDKRGQAYWRDYRRAKLGEPDAVARQGNMVANNFMDILRQSKEGNRVYSKIIMGTAPVYIYVDGVTINQEIPYTYAEDPVLLDALLPADIAQIDIITNVAKMGVLPSSQLTFAQAQPAVINILTKRGDYRINAVPSNALARQTTGYSPVREFYVPKYSPETPINASYPDVRTTLFWTPRLKTDANGQATITFPNSDKATRLRVVVNGLDGNGRAGSTQVESSGVAR